MSLYRNTVWMLKGLKEYTKAGYLSAAERFEQEDLDVDCTGKTFMITGSNSGIGKEAAMGIAERGGTVHMVCRNGKLAEEAKREIVTATNNDNVHVHLLDMSRPTDVHRFAERFADGLDVLVNNAGCMINAREVTPEGLEKNFATNVLGTHILTQGMIPSLRRSGGGDPRVILVSSGGMLTSKLDANDLQWESRPFDGTMVYAQNKRQQVIMAEKYSIRFPDVQFSSMHPGWANTPAVRNSLPSFYNAMKNRLRTPAQGADTVIWLAVTINPEAKDREKSGQFFQDRKVVPKHLPLAWSRSLPEDEEFLMRQLDDLSEKFKPKE